MKAAERAFYRRAMTLLERAGVPFLVGGAYAFEKYTGISRHTKDLDVFIRPADCRRTLKAFADAGYASELTFKHWLGKAVSGEYFVDIIFASGNGVCRVDDAWFERAEKADVFGLPAKLCPPEEMIWSKAFIMERERFDGADVTHLLRARGKRLDWDHLLERFGDHWRVLLAHLLIYDFVYPGERAQVPDRVVRRLAARLAGRRAQSAGLCRGTLLSRAQYLMDVERWGYQDARLKPGGPMNGEEVRDWTKAIAKAGDRERAMIGAANGTSVGEKDAPEGPPVMPAVRKPRAARNGSDAFPKPPSEPFRGVRRNAPLS